MANFVYNIAKGRVAEYYNRVQTNDPANSALVIVAINTSTADATLIDLDDLSAILADAGTAEVTNTGYARKVLTDVDLTALAPDDANDQMVLDLADQTWTAVAAGDNWTDLIICYDPDTTAGTDADLVPLTHHDFAVTPDGSDITATINNFYTAS